MSIWKGGRIVKLLRSSTSTLIQGAIVIGVVYVLLILGSAIYGEFSRAVRSFGGVSGLADLHTDTLRQTIEALEEERESTLTEVRAFADTVFDW